MAEDRANPRVNYYTRLGRCGSWMQHAADSPSISTAAWQRNAPAQAETIEVKVTSFGCNCCSSIAWKREAVTSYKGNTDTMADVALRSTSVRLSANSAQTSKYTFLEPSIPSLLTARYRITESMILLCATAALSTLSALLSRMASTGPRRMSRWPRSGPPRWPPDLRTLA